MSDDSVGAAQPKLHQFGDREAFEYAGAAGGFLDKNGYPFARGRIFESLEQDTGQYDDARDIFWASGTCLAVRKQLFTQLGGFEESFFMHMEEIDLCWRIKSLGFRIVLVPESVIFHMGGASLSKQSSRKHFLNYRNNLLMLYRNLPSKQWRFLLLRRMALDMAAVGKAIFSGQPGFGWAILRGYAAAFQLKNSHKTIRPLKHQRTAPLPYRGSIVWDYFIAGKKRFSDLDVHLFEAPRKD